MNTIAGLVGAVPGARLIGRGELSVAGVTHVAGQVRPGYLFVAIRGFKHNGEDYAWEAAARGAVGIVAEREVGPAGCAKLVVDNTRCALSALSAEFYGRPAKKLCVIGVTGTNGKTTTTFMVDSVLRCAGWKTGMIGTAGVRIGDQYYRAERTTPEAPEIHRYLREMVDCGAQAAIVEVSAQALSLERVRDCHFDVGVFTNLSAEHLNFYGAEEDYLRAKLKLFSSLNGTACVNGDDRYRKDVVAVCKVPVVLFGRERGDVRVEGIQQVGMGYAGTVISGDNRFQIRTFLPGLFNVYNALAAVAVAQALGIDCCAIAEGIARVRHVPGRYRILEMGGRTVWVDFAHNPEALRNILATARIWGGNRRLILVVGCEGGTDVAKRVETGVVAGEYADHVIVTSDNVYHDDPETVIDHIARGLRQAGRAEGDDFQRLADRYQAISQALELADQGSLVVVAGKGAEQHWVVGDRHIPFDDEQVCRDLLGVEAECVQV